MNSKVEGGGSLIYKSLKCNIVGPVSATWYPIPQSDQAIKYSENWFAGKLCLKSIATITGDIHLNNRHSLWNKTCELMH